MISVVINTCSLGPHAEEIRGSAGRSPTHNRRIYALRNFIIPMALAWADEVIVAGEWEPGPYKYLHVPSRHFNCADALAQRQAGFEASRGECVLFQHDDHLVHNYFPLRENADVWSPSRWTRLRSAEPERLNAGEGEYICGHAAIYRRAVLERCPWAAVPPVFTWDEEHTRQIREAGFTIVWEPTFRIYDVEDGSEPWR